MHGRILAGTIAAMSFFVAPAFAEEKTTQVVKPAFSLSLPGEWSLISEPADDFWQYQSRDGREGVSISIYSRPGTSDKNSIRPDFDRFLAAQRRAEANIKDTPMEVGETKITDEKGGAVRTACGSEPRRQTPNRHTHRDESNYRNKPVL